MELPVIRSKTKAHTLSTETTAEITFTKPTMVTRLGWEHDGTASGKFKLQAGEVELGYPDGIDIGIVNGAEEMSLRFPRPIPCGTKVPLKIHFTEDAGAGETINWVAFGYLITK